MISHYLNLNAKSKNSLLESCTGFLMSIPQTYCLEQLSMEDLAKISLGGPEALEPELVWRMRSVVDSSEDYCQFLETAGVEELIESGMRHDLAVKKIQAEKKEFVAGVVAIMAALEAFKKDRSVLADFGRFVFVLLVPLLLHEMSMRALAGKGVDRLTAIH